jgi:DNA-binding response OmpR family regulator
MGTPGRDGGPRAPRRRARAAGPTPILMLTAKSAEEGRIRELELGADDYVAKGARRITRPVTRLIAVI